MEREKSWLGLTLWSLNTSSCFSGKSLGPQGRMRLPNRINHGVMGLSCMGPVNCCKGSKCPVLWQTAMASSLRRSCCMCRSIVGNTAVGNWSRLVADQSDWSLVIVSHVIWVVTCIVACITRLIFSCIFRSVEQAIAFMLASRRDLGCA